MAAITNAENLRKHQRRFSLIVELILVFTCGIKLVREVKTACRLQMNYITMLHVIQIILIRQV